MKIFIDDGIIRRGRPYNLLIRERIIKILEQLTIASPQKIKEKYEKDYARSISWHTVNNRLVELEKDGVIMLSTVTPNSHIKGQIRTRIHRIYSLRCLKF